MAELLPDASYSIYTPVSGDFEQLPGATDWYRRLFDEALDGILLTSPDGVIHYANPAICRMLDRTEQELQTLGRAAVVDINDPHVQAAIEQRRRTGAFSGELTFVARDGRRIPVEISSFIFENPAGRQFTSMFVRDVTERAHAAEQLRYSEERFRTALRDSRVLVANVDRDGRYTWAYNPRGVFHRDDVIGKSNADLDATGDFGELAALSDEVLATRSGIRREIRITVQNEDRFLDVTVEPLLDAQHVVVGTTLAAADVTDSRRAEARQRFLAEASEALATSLEYEQTLTRVVQLAVPRFADLSLVDLQREDRVEQVALVHRDPEHEKLIREMRQRFPASSLPSSHPLKRVRATGTPMLVPQITTTVIGSGTVSDEHTSFVAKLGLRSAIFVPLQTHQDSLGVLSFYSTTRTFTHDDLVLALGLARHATLAIEKSRLYETVKRATIAREEVLSVVSHDLRNPLNAVSLCATTLLEGMVQDEEKRRGLYSVIARATESMTRLVSDLLDAGAIDAGKLSIEIEAASLVGIVEAVMSQLAPLAKERGIALRAELNPALPLVPADSSRIQQVLGNLVGNALKFTPGGGSVVVRTGAHDDDVLVSVSDTGSGIEPAQLPSHFRPVLASAP